MHYLLLLLLLLLLKWSAVKQVCVTDNLLDVSHIHCLRLFSLSSRTIPVPQCYQSSVFFCVLSVFYPLPRFTILFFRSIFNLLVSNFFVSMKAFFAIVILHLASLSHYPCSEMTDPRFLKLFTCSTFCPRFVTRKQSNRLGGTVRPTN